MQKDEIEKQSPSEEISEKLTDNQVKYLTDVVQTTPLESTWIHRKEIAAWTAFALYLFGIWSFFSFIANYDKPFGVGASYLITVLIPFSGVLIFAFIHSHYASIYSSHAYGLLTKKIQAKLIKEGKDTFHVLGELKPGMSEEMKKEHESILKDVQKYRGKCHPWQIFWRAFVFYFSFGRLLKPRALSNIEVQEAVIYIALVVANLSFLLYLFFSVLTRYK